MLDILLRPYKRGDHCTPISLPFYVLVVIFLYEMEEHNSALYYL